MPNNGKIQYFIAEIQLAQQGVLGLTLINLPIKTTLKNNFSRGVTLRVLLEKEVKNRLKGVEFLHMTLKEVSQCLLQEEFQCSEEFFISLETERHAEKSPTY